MATMDASPIFLDTNVLTYANVAGAPWHNEALQAIRDHEQAGIELWISRQIIREYLAVLTRPQAFTQPISSTTLATQVRLFQGRFMVADDDVRVTDELLSLVQQIPSGGKQIHDANIIATMRVHGVTRLLTHNVSDFARFSSLVTVVPLVQQAQP